MPDLSNQNVFQILIIFSQQQSLHMTMSVFIYACMISKYHRIFGNLKELFFRQRAASICGFVGLWVGRRKNLYALIGFQIANENHQKLDEIAVE